MEFFCVVICKKSKFKAVRLMNGFKDVFRNRFRTTPHSLVDDSILSGVRQGVGTQPRYEVPEDLPVET